MLTRFYQVMMERFCPQHLPKLSPWYIETIRDEFTKLINIELKEREAK
jgi:hypothetical protein